MRSQQRPMVLPTPERHGGTWSGDFLISVINPAYSSIGAILRASRSTDECLMQSSILCTIAKLRGLMQARKFSSFVFMAQNKLGLGFLFCQAQKFETDLCPLLLLPGYFTKSVAKNCEIRTCKPKM
ncbi:hypothetical protein BGZ63DRAFT_245449 [Mariannaea sp. PMI_226]|nr:hypothetical protein BGZ63DRAFT_245449 [Mariannaea sp. PMI_226]